MKQTIAMIMAAGLLLSGAVATAAQFKEGVNYERIVPEPEVGKPGDKIEVNEFFMWLCPHCYHFEPFVKKWQKNKPEDVEFVQIPAMFGGPANLHAKAFYALQAIGELDRVSDAFFHEIHENRNRLKTRDAVEAFLGSQGVDIKKFRDAMDSFAVAAKANRAGALMRRYGIHGVPALVVDGRYKSGRGLNFKEMTELADFLAERVRRERQEQSQ